MRNVKFQGIDEDLTAPNTPWIYYGVRVFLLAFLKMAINTDYFRCVRRRARMQERGRRTCAYFTLTSCLVLLGRVVRPALFSVLSRTTLNLTARFGHSAVTHAALTIWEYTDVIRLAADAKCSANLVKSISTIDGMLKISYLRGPLKKLFGLDGLKSDQDFVSVLTVCLFAVISRVSELVLTPACGSESARLVAGSELGSRCWLDDLC